MKLCLFKVTKSDACIRPFHNLTTYVYCHDLLFLLSRPYLQRNPHPSPPYHHQHPPSNFDTFDLYQRLSIETLFFIFYYMEVSDLLWMCRSRLVKCTFKLICEFVMCWFLGDKGTIFGGKSIEKTVVEIPHKVHDVVSKTRRAKSHHRWIWDGKIPNKYYNTTSTHFSSCREHIYILILKSGSNARKKASRSSTNFSKTKSYPEDGGNIAFHKCQQYLQGLVKFFSLFWHISLMKLIAKTKHPLKHSFNFRPCYSNSCSTLVFWCLCVRVCACSCVCLCVARSCSE